MDVQDSRDENQPTPIEEPTTKEYRVIWRRTHWEGSVSRLFQRPYFAERFAGRLEEGQPSWGDLSHLEIQEREVGSWKSYQGKTQEGDRP